MATIYYEKDTDTGVLADQEIAVLGFGSQGHAHAQNLKDSGFDVRVGLRPGSASRRQAEDAGIRVLDTAEAVAEADVVMCLLPDTSHGAVYASDIEPNLKDGDMLMFAHGFSIHFGTVVPPAGVDITMIAPKGPGHLVRRTYVEGNGTPGLVAVQQDATGKALERRWPTETRPAARPGIIRPPSRKRPRQTVGEQTVLRWHQRGDPQRVQTLVEAGYQLEIATSVPARTEADHRPIYEGGLSDALQRQRHRERRLRERSAWSMSTRGSRCERSSPTSGRHVREELDRRGRRRSRSSST
jgi:ketol-acid reductoisomerase